MPVDISPQEIIDILESIGDAFYALDEERRIAYVNRRAEEIWGRRREELIGRRIEEAFPAVVGSPAWQEMLRVMQERRPAEFETASPVIGRWIRITICPRPRGISIHFRDISDRKRTEEALRRLNETLEERVAERTRQLAETNRQLLERIDEQLRAEEALRREENFSQRLIESSHDGILAFDLDGRYTVWNPAMERITGRPAIDVLGRRAAEVLVFPENPDDDITGRVLAGEQVVVSERAFHVEGTDRSGFLEAHYAPLQGENGAIIGGIGVVNDVTQRIQQEAALRHAQKMEAVGQLTGGLAHDFNNLLTVIGGNLELLESRITSDPKITRLVAAAQQAAARGERLTQLLLAFSRKQRLNPEPLAVDRVLTELLELLRRTVDERIEIHVEAGPGVPPAFADRNQLETAILNLVFNARDAMQEGGRVSLAVAATELAAAAGTAPGPYVEIRVSDTGIGMSRETLARAFEPFFTTKAAGRGTGLGLSQVYGFAKQSGGHVAIDSVPGKGTTVRLYLPQAPAGQAKGSGEAPTQIAAG